jgi:cytochrome c oxidase subunit 3
VPRGSTVERRQPIGPESGVGDWGGGGDDLSDGGGGGGDGQSAPRIPDRTPPLEGYRLGMWLTLVSVTILFLALTVFYLFNGAQRKPIIMPPVLWVSTLLILLSSGTMEVARRALRRRLEGRFQFWIAVTTLLGLGFLAAQLLAWQALTEAGFFINRNFRSGYAYLFTGLHGVHLLGGLLGLLYLARRRAESWTVLRRRVSVDMMALYWHFLDGLWIYLWGLVFLWQGGVGE